MASTVVGHVLYPAVLHLAARRRPCRHVEPVVDPPPVTVLVPAYLEAGVIGAKVANVLANGYRGDLEILVVADGDPETAGKAEAAGARVLLLPERGGKSQALNAGVAAATHDLVVMSDANSALVPGAIEHLVAALVPEGVGAVAGEKREGEGGELAYWRFEAWLKRNEDRLGTTLGLDGGLCAVKRSAWAPIPADISNDDFWMALDLMERGHAVAYEPRAVVEESSIGSLGRSWERRTRVVSGGLWVMWRKRRLLLPRGPVTAQLWGHKLWRSTLGPLSHLGLIVLAVSRARHSRLARLFLGGHAVAGAALVAQENGRTVPLAARIPAMAVYLHLVAFGGMIRCLRGDRVVRWAKPAR
ncbi:glycosyltransferase [Pseudonocardia nigra]|uniref:glycosyltransferase n=1 Tax=Pseudonocardia nigra TaxID=1921578 RepID=UPI001C5F54C2|nr:glycosyltransferase [Pseudonocardia nigra]